MKIYERIVEGPGSPNKNDLWIKQVGKDKYVLRGHFNGEWVDIGASCSEGDDEGGGDDEEDDTGPSRSINFIDYDGTVVASYSPSEFKKLSALPANPTHPGLVGQGWNMSLANAKAIADAGGSVNIGQMYITDDGKTRIYVHVPIGWDNYIGLAWKQTEDNGVVVDWGDGSPTETTVFDPEDYACYLEHSYAEIGDYVITMECVEGTFETEADWGTFVYAEGCQVYKIEFGDNFTGINESGLMELYTLRSVTIPDSVTTIGESAFFGCTSLQSVTIPDSVTTIGESAFFGCTSLQSVTIPDSVTTIGDSAFSYCTSLQSVTIPDSVTTIGDSAFSYCTSLRELTTAILGDSEEPIFSYLADYVERVTILPGPTEIPESCFSSFEKLRSVTIPDSVTTIGESAFFGCTSLQSVTIPDSVTTIGESAFSYCTSLQSVTIPDSVTTISPGAFIGTKCIEIIIPPSVTSLGDVPFGGESYFPFWVYCLADVPPVVGEEDEGYLGLYYAFVYVPAESYDDYKEATGWVEIYEEGKLFPLPEDFVNPYATE